jgi:hypothetical protein
MSPFGPGGVTVAAEPRPCPTEVLGQQRVPDVIEIPIPRDSQSASTAPPSVTARMSSPLPAAAIADPADAGLEAFEESLELRRSSGDRAGET